MIRIQPSNSRNSSNGGHIMVSLAAMPPARRLIADKGYDANSLRGTLGAQGTEAVNPRRSLEASARGINPPPSGLCSPQMHPNVTVYET